MYKIGANLLFKIPGSRLQGMKNLLTSAIWGVPYAQVAEDSHRSSLADISVNAEEMDVATPAANKSLNKEGRCIIS